MTVTLLPYDEARALREAPFTYTEVGATRGDSPPDGFHHLARSRPVGRGEKRFADVAEAVLGWRMHRGAGLTVHASDARVTEGTVAVVRLGVGPLGVDAPVRVVHVVDEPARQGFAYGTLRGHPECGEESFVAELAADGTVRLTITAFSRPATVGARLGGPLTRAVQRRVTERYLRAV
jgi:uncharacterized protein (UPF0548 family)